MDGSIKEGIRLYKNKKWELALAELLRVPIDGEEIQEAEEVAYYLGLCYIKLERFDDALLYLEQVITANPVGARAYQCRFALAFLYLLTGRPGLAEFELSQLLNLGQETARIYTMLGYAQWTKKNTQGAIENYRRALELDEDNPTALNGLGFILADSDHDVRKGLALCEKAVNKKPDSSAYMDSLGWAHFKNGNLPEARTWLRRALDLNPSAPEIQRHLSIVNGEIRS